MAKQVLKRFESKKLAEQECNEYNTRVPENALLAEVFQVPNESVWAIRRRTGKGDDYVYRRVNNG